MAVLQERFQTRVRYALKKRGWSQADLARRMEVDPPYLSQYLAGRRCPGLDVVERFAVALQVDPGTLLAEIDLSELAELAR